MLVSGHHQKYTPTNLEGHLIFMVPLYLSEIAYHVKEGLSFNEHPKDGYIMYG
jgi:hypothetical protein